MVCGEAISVARKHKTPVDVNWTVPMAVCGNFMPDYDDAQGCISRRLAVVRFETVVGLKDMTLAKRIQATELSAILNKVLDAYFETVKEHGTQEFRRFCPEYMRQGKAAVRSNSNTLYRFLTAEEDEYVGSESAVFVRRKEGSLVVYKEFETAYAKYMRDNHATLKRTSIKVDDECAYGQLGYVVRKVNVCKSCGKQSLKGCCEAYSSENRKKIKVVLGIELVHVKDLQRVDNETILAPRMVREVGHAWNADTSSAAERRFKAALEEHLPGCVFVKEKPTWLINPRTGCEMELDLYNRDRILAIEYNGPHHYEYPNWYHKTKVAFLRQRERDMLKVKLCREHGIMLIVIRLASSIQAELLEFDTLYAAALQAKMPA